MSERMTVKEFDSLKPIDFQNGAVLDEIRCALKELESFLHGEKEQPDEWEEWIQRMPKDMLTGDWFKAMQQWFREMPRGS